MGFCPTTSYSNKTHFSLRRNMREPYVSGIEKWKKTGKNTVSCGHVRTRFGLHSCMQKKAKPIIRDKTGATPISKKAIFFAQFCTPIFCTPVLPAGTQRDRTVFNCLRHGTPCNRLLVRGENDWQRRLGPRWTHPFGLRHRRIHFGTR